MSELPPEVSVVVPVHNGASYLAQTFDQLGALDRGVRYEFLVVDDHSTDDSARIIDDLADTLAGDVTVIRSRDRGVAAARNEALARCSGTYVWLTDADDQWDPLIVTAMLERAEATGADLVTCDAVKITPDGGVVGIISDGQMDGIHGGEEAFLQLLNGSLQGHLWNKLFRRELLGVAPFPPLTAHSDLAAMLHVIPRAQRVAAVGRVLYRYVQNPGSILNSKSFDPANLRTCLAIATESGARPGPARARALLQFKYRNVLLPIMGEFVRRSDQYDRRSRKEHRRQIRREIVWKEVPRLLTLGGPQLALQAALLKVSGAAYAALYGYLKPSTATR